MPGSYLHCEITATVKSDRSGLEADTVVFDSSNEPRTSIAFIRMKDCA
jgi:hypothetical protein